MERTLVLIKPDAMERKLMGKIISVYEQKGFSVSSIKVLKPSRNIAAQHYAELKEKAYFEEILTYITRSEVCAMIIEGENAIGEVRKINGATDPQEADEDTIRRQFAISKAENAVHSSDSAENAEKEIGLWFSEKELHR
ncbi:nucleoside-diphosphate kinase [Anaerobium acetethylicum]|uniref:Nucleoside diphosphate kinase n=1 Tax=Anaerobium acetethylicum TaxID=1619234 RepID=A0A1D3TX90_9FIRM|nr:nucleoside-diphosphate kinase [Anaerobium acetethylicum]SCP98933.1 nucleoside-diphosphate kinase [Anaerobium acetethylicum]